MDKSNNKKRLLALIKILRKNTNEDRKLKLPEIVSRLKEEGDTQLNTKKNAGKLEKTSQNLSRNIQALS